MSNERLLPSLTTPDTLGVMKIGSAQAYVADSARIAAPNRRLRYIRDAFL
jgi:hypothetical protein